MRHACSVTFLLFAACTSGSVEARRDGAIVHVTIDDQPFADVHCDAEPRPYVFPVLGPGGVAMTRSFPMGVRPDEENDHPHHQSLWFAHGSVNGFDFWAGKSHRERIVLDGPCETVHEGGAARVRCHYRWLVDDDTLVATEQRDLVFGGTADARTIDMVVTLRPGPTPLVLGDTKEGTFALRVHPKLRVEGKVASGVLRNSEGASGKDVWGKRARWIDDSGTVDGHAVGIAMFDHPSNASFPTWWHARTYGLLAANPFGVHDFENKPEGTGACTVPVGGSLELRYRVVLHGKDWDAARLEAAYAEWVRP